MEYMKKAQALSDKNPIDVGARRRLRIELQERYGLLEIEAMNILNGHLINEYVNRYNRIKNEIVVHVNEEFDFQTWISNEMKKQDEVLAKDDGWSFKDD